MEKLYLLFLVSVYEWEMNDWFDKRDESEMRNILFSTTVAIGFNVETVTYKNIKFQVWDLGGQTSIRLD